VVLDAIPSVWCGPVSVRHRFPLLVLRVGAPRGGGHLGPSVVSWSCSLIEVFEVLSEVVHERPDKQKGRGSRMSGSAAWR
jgi:hypothetical protein